MSSERKANIGRCTMSNILPVNGKSFPSDDQIDSEKKKIGNLLRRMRLETVKENGRKITIADVAESIEESQSTVNQAEKGKLTLYTYLKLMGFYRNQKHLAFTLLSASDEKNFIPENVLRKFANAECLTTTEFVRAVTLFPSQVFRINRRAYFELKRLGFATRVDMNMRGDKFYAADPITAKKSDETWELPVELAQKLVNENDQVEYSEMCQWACDTLREAIKQKPEYQQLVEAFQQ